jgi:hypothetical protein
MKEFCVYQNMCTKKIVHKFTLDIYVFCCERGEADAEAMDVDGRKPGDAPSIPFGTLSTNLVMAATCKCICGYYHMQSNDTQHEYALPQVSECIRYFPCKV